MICLIVFCFLLLNLLSAIILTINTPPGDIPKDYEWDIDENAVEAYTDADRPIEEPFENQEIVEDSTAPRV